MLRRIHHTASQCQRASVTATQLMTQLLTCPRSAVVVAGLDTLSCVEKSTSSADLPAADRAVSPITVRVMLYLSGP